MIGIIHLFLLLVVLLLIVLLPVVLLLVLVVLLVLLLIITFILGHLDPPPCTLDTHIVWIVRPGIIHLAGTLHNCSSTFCAVAPLPDEYGL